MTKLIFIQFNLILNIIAILEIVSIIFLVFIYLLIVPLIFFLCQPQESSKATGLIRNGGGGRAVASHSYLSTTKDAANVHIHEMGHSIWRLADEYDETGRILGVNRALLTDTSEENIPWKEFLNFRGIGLVSTAPKNPDRYKEYIPSKLCLMKVVVNLNVDFCEVCTHQIIKRGVQITQNEHFYIADPHT